MKTQLIRIAFAITTLLIGTTTSAAAVNDAEAATLLAVCPGESCAETAINLSKTWEANPETNSDLGTAVAILLEIAQQSDESGVATISDAMVALAAQSSEPSQQEAIISAAQVVRDGNAAQFDLAQPFAASPSDFRFPRRPWRRFQLNGNRPQNGNPRFGFGRFVRTMFGWARGNGRP